MQSMTWSAALIQNTTSWLYPGGQYRTPLTAASVIEFRASFTGAIEFLYVFHEVAGVTSATLVYTLGLNGTDTALTVSCNNTSAGGSDTTHVVSVTANDRVRMKCVVPNSITPPTRVFISAHYHR